MLRARTECWCCELEVSVGCCLLVVRPLPQPALHPLPACCPASAPSFVGSMPASETTSSKGGVGVESQLLYNCCVSWQHLWCNMETSPLRGSYKAPQMRPVGPLQEARVCLRSYSCAGGIGYRRPACAGSEGVRWNTSPLLARISISTPLYISHTLRMPYTMFRWIRTTELLW